MLSGTEVNSRVLLAVLTILCAFCNIGYELLLVRAVVVISTQVIIFTTVTLGVFLLFTGVGSLVADRVQSSVLIRRLFLFEGLLCMVGVFSVFGVIWAYFLCKTFIYRPSGNSVQKASEVKWIFLWSSQGFSAILGFLSGMEFSLLIRLSSILTRPQRATPFIFINYVGAFLGTLFFSFYFIPVLDLYGTAITLGLLNVSVLALLGYLGFNHFKKRDLIIIVLSMSCIVMVGAKRKFMDDLLLKTRYLRGVYASNILGLPSYIEKVIFSQPDVRRIHTRYQYADFVEDPTVGTLFYLDGQLQLDPRWSKRYHEGLVHLPIQFRGKIPKKVLILGGGDGGVAYELLKYADSVEAISLVELDSEIVKMAKTEPSMLVVNHHSLADPKVHIIIADAIRFLRECQETFDAIYLDFPLPHDYDLLKLYSVEFYQMVVKRLNADGFIALDPGSRFGPADLAQGNYFRNWNQSIVSSLYFAGLKTIVPFQSGDGFFMASVGVGEKANSEWKDFNIPTTVVNREYMRKAFVPEFSLEPNRDSVISMFNPKLFIFRDAAF